MGFLDTRNLFFIVFIIIILVTFIYWYLTRPTVQDTIVKDFYNQIRKGNVENASKYLINEDFGEFLYMSTITDSDGSDALAGIEKTRETLRDLAMTFIPMAKGHVPIFSDVILKTQRSETDKNLSFVTFEFDFLIKERFDEPALPGDLKGTAELHKIDNRWQISRTDMTIYIHNTKIRNYWEY